ncbi:MAG TPA: hypothetical protein VGM43_05810 [Bryobacteraceae bacterium]
MVIAGKPSNYMPFALRPARPGIFTIPGTPVNGGPLYASALNQDGATNSQRNPAPRGSIVAPFGTGFGSLSRTPADGTLVPLPLSTHTLNMEEFCCENEHFISANAGPAQWAGQAPLEFAGLSQISVRVPDTGSSLFLTESEGDPSSTLSVFSNRVNLWIK